MSSFPDDIEAYYVELADRREWSAETFSAIRSTVEVIRELDRGTAPAMLVGNRIDEQRPSVLQVGDHRHAHDSHRELAPSEVGAAREVAGAGDDGRRCNGNGLMNHGGSFAL